MHRYTTFALMENVEQRWAQTEDLFKSRFGKLPDMEGMLFLIGINELGTPDVKKFTKEQKQDIMHVAVCTLLTQLGIYAPAGNDLDGWPHFELLVRPEAAGLQNQEQMLKECIIRYFDL